MKQVALSVASNVAEGRENMTAALSWLGGILKNLRHSTFYTTAALNGKSTYLNAVAMGCCDMPCEALNALLKEYEKQAGRTPQMRALKLVPIDIDIVVYDGFTLRPRDFGEDFFQKGWKELELFLEL